MVRAQEPDLVIVDIRMPPEQDTEGLDAARVIRSEWPAGAVIPVSIGFRSCVLACGRLVTRAGSTVSLWLSIVSSAGRSTMRTRSHLGRGAPTHNLANSEVPS